VISGKINELKSETIDLQRVSFLLRRIITESFKKEFGGVIVKSLFCKDFRPFRLGV
jgi:hypothetical protein